MLTQSIQGMPVNNSNPFLHQIFTALDLMFDGIEGPERILDLFQSMELSHTTDLATHDTPSPKQLRETLFDMQLMRNAILSMGHAYIMLLDMQSRPQPLPKGGLQASAHFQALIDQLIPITNGKQKHNKKESVRTATN